ncbi:hypothetical protein TW65_02270 [Stemphylium lycopersici]|nr:hypothetical protein TW65_02270 [Stemphylium lycopersici]
MSYAILRQHRLPSPRLRTHSIRRTPNNVETAILRTSKETYYEAFDVMIKTNRFVKTSSEPGLPIKAALNGQRVPMFTVDKDLVDRFEGYVLGMHLGLSGPKLERENSDLALFGLDRYHPSSGSQQTGRFETSVAIAVRRKLVRDQYSHPSVVLAEFTAAKESGFRLYQQRNIEKACLQWQDAALDVDKMIQTSS